MFPTESPGSHRLEVTSGQPLHMGSLVTEDSVYRHTTPHCGCLLPALVSGRYLETTCPVTPQSAARVRARRRECDVT